MSRWVVKADPKTDAEWQRLCQPRLWVGHSLADPSAKWDAAAQWSWWGWGVGNDTTEEGDGGGNRLWRAVLLEGQEKEEPQGGSGNDQVVYQERGEKGQEKLSLPPFSSSSDFLPTLCLFPFFSLFSTLPHFFISKTTFFILKSHSLLTLRHMAFLPAGVRQWKPRKALTQESRVACSAAAGLPNPQGPRAPRTRSRAGPGYRYEGAQSRESSCSPLHFLFPAIPCPHLHRLQLQRMHCLQLQMTHANVPWLEFTIWSLYGHLPFLANL